MSQSPHASQVGTQSFFEQAIELSAQGGYGPLQCIVHVQTSFDQSIIAVDYCLLPGPISLTSRGTNAKSAGGAGSLKINVVMVMHCASDALSLSRENALSLSRESLRAHHT